VGVAFRLACAFIGFSDVVVSLSDVGPGGRFLAGGGGRGGGRVWVEGVHGGDKAEGDGEETREDDRGGFVVVVAIKVVAIVVVLGIGIFPIIVVVAIKSRTSSSSLSSSSPSSSCTDSRGPIDS
jgi:hypothetical protein